MAPCLLVGMKLSLNGFLISYSLSVPIHCPLLHLLTCLISLELDTDLTLVPALGGFIGSWLNPCHYLSQLRGCSQDMGKVVKDLVDTFLCVSSLFKLSLTRIEHGSGAPKGRDP
jgi:hypothetical protein